MYKRQAPTIQLLQGINSYSLDGKAVKEEGFDQETQQFYSNTYGRSYIGARDKNSFIQFDPVSGLKIHGAEIDVSTDNFTINDSEGNQIAVFEIGENGKPRLKADNINADELLSNGDKWALKRDGSGFLASNNIEWNKNGLLKIRANIAYPYIEYPLSSEGVVLDLSKGYNIRLAYGSGVGLYMQIAILPDPTPVSYTHLFALNLKESDNTGTTFEIVRNEDYGRALPDDTLFPQAAHMEDGEEVPADTYVLYGFDTAFISEQMLPDAEQELLKKAKEYVKKSMIDPTSYVRILPLL